MSETVSSIPARTERRERLFVASFLCALLQLAAAPADAQVGSGEWAAAAEAGATLSDSATMAPTIAVSLTSNLLPGPVLQARTALTGAPDGSLQTAASVAAIAAFDALSWIPYAGLSAGLRLGPDLRPSAGMLLGVDHRAERASATGVLLLIEAVGDPTGDESVEVSGALLLSYRWLFDTLATPEL